MQNKMPYLLERYTHIYCIICLLFLYACADSNQKDFIKIGNQADFKIISFTTNSNIIEPGDLVEFKSYYFINNQHVLSPDSSKLNELFNDTITFNPDKESAIIKIITKLQEGDSCLSRFYGDVISYDRINPSKNKFTKGDTIYNYIKVKRVYKGKEKMAYLLEENAIARYISFSSQPWKASESGIFYRIVKPSNEPKLKFDDAIKFVYKGYFLNNQVFDNYGDINPYFEFKIGTQNQLIRGLELGLAYLSYGAEAEFIIPSSLAFGKQGSSTGIVPAYKPVLYKVKIFEKETI
jgi:FKBP-type peptidyl-prolyl cis-trans isomerase